MLHGCIFKTKRVSDALDQMRKDIAASAVADVADVAEKNNASDVDAAAAADNVT